MSIFLLHPHERHQKERKNNRHSKYYLCTVGSITTGSAAWRVPAVRGSSTDPRTRIRPPRISRDRLTASLMRWVLLPLSPVVGFPFFTGSGSGSAKKTDPTSNQRKTFWLKDFAYEEYGITYCSYNQDCHLLLFLFKNMSDFAFFPEIYDAAYWLNLSFFRIFSQPKLDIFSGV